MPEASDQMSTLQRLMAAPTAQPRWNTEVVRSAWSGVQRRRRDANSAAARSAGDLSPEPAVAPESLDDPLSYGWIDQLWTDHIIVRNGDNSEQAVRVPYTVEGQGSSVDDVKFGAPERVRMAYVAASRSGLDAVLAAAATREADEDLVALGQFPFNKGKGAAPAGPSAAPIKDLGALNSAIAAYNKAKPADRPKLKARLLSEAKRLKAPPAVIARIRALGGSAPPAKGSGKTPPSTGKSSGKPSFPFKKGQPKVAASNVEDVLELTKRVRSMQGARRYRKPIGTPLGDGTSNPGATLPGVRAPGGSASKDPQDATSKDKVSHGGKVFGNLGSPGKLKQALASIDKLPEGKVGAAAAEIVLAAQSLGLTSLVPTKVKRLYREYLAQKPKSGGKKDS